MMNTANIMVKGEAESKTYIENYWSKRAEGFAQLRLKELHSEKYLRWEKELLSRIGLNVADRPLRVLDVGCGAGFFSVLLARHGCCVTGVDLTSDMIEQAQALAEQELPGDISKPFFRTMDAENLTFADNTFDVVLSRNLTWNLPYPVKAYSEWLRVLKSGGLLLNYDGEYARDHHNQRLPQHNAHEKVPVELLEECHKIYHMLSISLENRPAWDKEVLDKLGAIDFEADVTVGAQIYKEADIFYIPVPLFRVSARKK